MTTTEFNTSNDTGAANPWDFPSPFTVSITPAANEIDGLKHTNNAVYVQWCEAIAWAHSKAIGLDITDYQRLDRGMAIRRGEYDYLLPSSLGNKLILGTWLTASDGKLTLERRFQLVRELDHATILRGRWELVCIELSSGSARRMPAEFRQVYLPALCGQEHNRHLNLDSSVETCNTLRHARCAGCSGRTGVSPCGRAQEKPLVLSPSKDARLFVIQQMFLG